MTNPVEAALYIPEHISMRHDHPASYKPDPDWEVRLHGWLRAAWPCPERGMVDTLLHDIAAELEQCSEPVDEPRRGGVSGRTFPRMI